MASNGYQWSYERNKPVKANNIYEVDAITTLTAQVEAISKRLDTMQVQPQSPMMSCESWGNQAGPSSPSFDRNASIEQVDYVGWNNSFQNNPYNGTYNIG